MGMYDTVWFDKDLPDATLAGRDFQTKSLHQCLDRYTVTRDGRLCLSGNEGLEGDEINLRKEEYVDTGFHGDLRLTSVTGGKYAQYVARFTHGTLEWVRPIDNTSSAHETAS